jgi:hypothetical protein
MNISLVSHAIAMKLLAAIADEADETTLKTAMASFPAIIAEVLEEAVKAAG